MCKQRMCSRISQASARLFGLALLVAASLACVTLSACAHTSDLSSEQISVYSREDGSGTRGAFAELLGLETEMNGKTVDTITPRAVVTNSTAVMMTSVASDPAAIGYISYGSLNDMVKALEIDGVSPTSESIKDKSYPIFRAFSLVTNEPVDPAADSDGEGGSHPTTAADAPDAADTPEPADDKRALIQDFMRFVASQQGQGIIEENRFVGSVEDPQTYTHASNQAKPAGKLVIAGSSSVAGVMEKLAEAYEQENPDVSLEIQQSDSTTGIAMVEAGTCDIGMTSRNLTETETASGMFATPLAFDGIAVIVSPTFPLDGLTSQEVRDIFSAETTTFSELPSWSQAETKED